MGDHSEDDTAIPGHAGEPDHRSPGHAVVRDAGGDTAAPQGRAATVGAGHQATLGGGHGYLGTGVQTWDYHTSRSYLDPSAIQVERPHHSHRHGHVPDHVLTTRPKNLLIVVVLVRQLLQRLLEHGVLAVELPPDPHTSARVAQGLLKLEGGS